MYDIYDKTCILTNQEKLLEVLKKGYRNIYYKEKTQKSHRKSKLKWMSPYKELSDSSYFLVKENNLRYFGNVKEVYFSSRYAEDRKLVRSWYESYLNQECLDSCAVVGSGIGPYSITLSSLFKHIDEFQINRNAIRYSKINRSINKVSNISTHEHSYKNEVYDHIIAVMPSKNMNYNLNYKFNKTLCVYIILNPTDKEQFQKRSCNRNYKQLYSRIVRPYGKNINVYRYIFTRN